MDNYLWLQTKLGISRHDLGRCANYQVDELVKLAKNCLFPLASIATFDSKWLCKQLQTHNIGITAQEIYISSLHPALQDLYKSSGVNALSAQKILLPAISRSPKTGVISVPLLIYLWRFWDTLSAKNDVASDSSLPELIPGPNSSIEECVLYVVREHPRKKFFFQLFVDRILPAIGTDVRAMTLPKFESFVAEYGGISSFEGWSDLLEVLCLCGVLSQGDSTKRDDVLDLNRLFGLAGGMVRENQKKGKITFQLRPYVYKDLQST